MSRPVDPLARVEFAALLEEGMSATRHDIRNKLGSIRNAAFYIRKRLLKAEVWLADPRLETMASLLDADVARANELLGCVDDRLHVRHVQPVDARKSVMEAIEHARIAPSARIEVELPSVTVSADERELSVAVRCLIENAAEATSPQGSVRLSGDMEGSLFWIRVHDEGPGLPDEARQLALGAFYSTKPGHVGLGLNVAQRIAQRYGGRLVFLPARTGTSVALAVDLSGKEKHVEYPAG